MDVNRLENDSYGPKDTYKIGYELGLKAKKGQVICLYGDLGVGKTVFTKGFAGALGIKEPITSPTFTIIQEYQEGRIPFYHFDVYRISDISELDEIGFDDYIYGDGVCFVEWAGLVEEALPKERIEITIKKDLDIGLDYRKIIIKELA